MKKKSILLSFMVLLVSAALCACGGGKKTETSQTANTSSEGTPTSGGSVVFGMTQDLVSLDPHQITDAGTRSVVFNIYEGLVKPTSTGDLEPAIASDYTISEDAKTYTFTLRDGVTFHDGSPVTAEDVKYSIERYAEIQGESSAFSSLLDKVVIDDDKTVTIQLKEGYSEFLADLTLAVIPAANEDPEGSPIGTGPFKFVSYTPGQELVLAKNENYWQSGVPYLDGATFKIIADTDTAFTQLQAGTIDILNYLTTAQVQTLEQMSGGQFSVVEGNMNLVHAMYLNNAYEPLSNVQVRQALCYAVNREEINQFLFNGKSHLIGSHMIPALTTWYEPSTENMYEYNVDKAKELLAAAGYGDGFDLEISVPSSYSQHVDTAQIIADQLSKVGINATIKKVEWGTWLEDVYTNRNYQATVIGFDGTLAPSDWLKKYGTEASNNIANYSNADYDKTLAQALAAVDTDEKAKLYKQLQVNLAENAASVYIEDPADFVAVNSKFGGYTSYPTAAWDMSKIYMKTAQ